MKDRLLFCTYYLQYYLLTTILLGPRPSTIGLGIPMPITQLCLYIFQGYYENISKDKKNLILFLTVVFQDQISEKKIANQFTYYILQYKLQTQNFFSLKSNVKEETRDVKYYYFFFQNRSHHSTLSSGSFGSQRGPSKNFLPEGDFPTNSQIRCQCCLNRVRRYVSIQVRKKPLRHKICSLIGYQYTYITPPK